MKIDTPGGLPHHAPAMNAPEPRPEDPAPPLDEGAATPPEPAPAPVPEPAPAPVPEPENVVAEVASDVRAAIAPVGSAMKADVGNLADFLRGIQSGYLLAGLGLLAATALVGVLVTLFSGFSDWFMHLAMYLVLISFALLYVRAHQRNYRIMRAIWAVLGLGLIAFFAWILIDLVPARLDVLSGRPRPGGLTGPEVALRPHAGALWVPALMLCLVGLWLLSHWLVLARFRKPRGPRVS